MGWFIIIAVVVVFIWWYRKGRGAANAKDGNIITGVNQFDEINAVIDNSPVIPFFNKSKWIAMQASESHVECQGVIFIANGSENLAVAVINMTGAAQMPTCIMWAIKENGFKDKLADILLGQLSIETLIEAIDPNMINEHFGMEVDLKPGSVSEGDLEMFVMWTIPDGISANDYFSCIKRKLEKDFSVTKKDEKAFIHVSLS